jgi:hypothetical protein
MIVRGVLVLTLLAPLFAACGDGGETPNGSPVPGAASGRAASPGLTAGLSPQQEVFWDRLQALCGRAFQGRILLAPPDDPWWDAERVVMHVLECHEDEIRIPLHIDENRSRTWVVTRTGSGLRLKHDHRLADGSPDETNTQYGGDTVLPGSIWRQEFPADAYSVDAVPGRESQLWYLEIRPGDAFAYGLRREATGLRYHLEFDVTDPVEAPPPPWGW